MKIFFFFISLLHQAISYSWNSCEEPILFSDYVSITGPNGASASCSSPPNSMISMENLPERKTNDGYSDHMVPNRRPLRRPTQFAHSTSSSLVQDQYRSTNGGKWIDICLPTDASSSATAQSTRLSTYAAIQLSTEYVIQLIGVWDQNHYTIREYDRFAFNTQSTKRSEYNWYSTLEDGFDQHRTWSLFFKGASQRLKRSFPATYLNIFPMMGEYPKGIGTLTNFTIVLYGCKAETTSVISLEFKTSKNEISSRFGSISTFLEQMIKFVCLMAGLDETPDSGRRVQFADLQEITAPNPAWTLANSRFEPTTLTSIIVSFRIMPTRGKYCTDCRSAQVVKSTLLSDFGNPNSNNSNILQAIDKWIIDPDAYMCKTEKCPTGYSCVIGVCLTDLAGVKTPPSDSDINFTNPFSNSTLIDTVLNLSPLQVIAGIDQSQGRIIFSNHPPAAGSLPGILISKAYTESTNDADESFHHRFMIPIAVVSSFTLIILGILSWKAYSRISRKNTTGDFS